MKTSEGTASAGILISVTIEDEITVLASISLDAMNTGTPGTGVGLGKASAAVWLALFDMR